MGDEAGGFEAIIGGRRSVRAFRSTPVDPDIVERILDVSARAPSGTNMQPWKVWALAGDALAELKSTLLLAEEDTAATREAEYQYYPSPIYEPYLARRRKVGFDLYGILGIVKGDTERMRRQHARNLMFFDAPVGLIFTIDRGLKIGSWLDYGMFLENVMIAARAHGLETCAQAAFAPFQATIRRSLSLPDDEVVVCGMALGYEDADAPENGLVTTRVPARDFATFLGFDDKAEAR